MFKYTILALLGLCVFNIVAYANPLVTRNHAADHKDEAGFGIGALIGGLIAGPPGAIIGATGGTWYGERQNQRDRSISQLQQALADSRGELVAIQQSFSHYRKEQQDLQKVRMQEHRQSTRALSEALSLPVYFRTGSSELQPADRPAIQSLAHYLNKFPQLKVHLEAHADYRGAEDFNRALSQQRADTVRRELIQAGLKAVRIHTHAYGESRSKQKQNDSEALMYDRRVNITLALDKQT